MGLLELRKAIKARKPEFKRQDSNKRKEVSDSWRRPKGIQSKMRLRKKGHPRAVEKGWRSPKDVRGLSKDGLRQILVTNAAQISVLDSKNDGAIIAKGVGLRKRLMIIEEAGKKGIKLLNANPEKIMRKEAERKEQKEKSSKKKAKQEKPRAPKKEKEPKKEAEMTEEERKEAEKKEKDKVLTKRDI